MYIGAEFYQERHGEMISLYLSENGPRCLEMNQFEIEGRLFRMWDATQKLMQIYVSSLEIGVLSCLNLDAIYHQSQRNLALISWTRALQSRGLIILVEGKNDLYEIAGNAKRIQTIIDKKKSGKEAAMRRWKKNKTIGEPIGNPMRTHCNDNDNDNVSIYPAIAKAPARRNPKEKSKGSLLFDEYKAVYLTKHDHCPPAGSAEYAQLKRLLTKVGFEMAKDMLGFYIVDYKSEYCEKAKHPIGLFTHNFNDIYLKFKAMYPEAVYERVSKGGKPDGEIDNPAGSTKRNSSRRNRKSLADSRTANDMGSDGS